MSDHDDNPPSNVPAAPGTSAPEGGGNVSTPPAGSTLESINKATGRTYPNLEAALAGIGETYRHVGAPRVETPPAAPVAPAVPAFDPSTVVSRAEFENAEFFRDNPEANRNRTLLEQLALANPGTKVQDIFNGNPETSPVAKLFKDTAARLKVADDLAGARSALTSDPRLGIVSDDSTKAFDSFEASQKARAAGDLLGADRYQKEAEKHAISAVIGAYGLNGKRVTD